MKSKILLYIASLITRLPYSRKLSLRVDSLIILSEEYSQTKKLFNPKPGKLRVICPPQDKATDKVDWEELALLNPEIISREV